MQTEFYTYLARCGLQAQQYQFSICRISSYYRIYLEKIPDYRGQNRDLRIVHCYMDIQKRPYICWTEPIRSVEDAKKIARAWADRTQNYICTGICF